MAWHLQIIEKVVNDAQKKNKSKKPSREVAEYHHLLLATFAESE